MNLRRILNLMTNLFCHKMLRKVIGVDDTAKLITTVTCEKALRNPSEDDMGSGIANKSHICNEA